MESPDAVNEVTWLWMSVYRNRLFEVLRAVLAATNPELGKVKPDYGEFRPGAVRRSQVDMATARRWPVDPSMNHNITTA
jgi:hypothetical protein